MANQRSPNKRLIGAQVSLELSAAIDAWLEANPDKSMTDFILSASIEKLKTAGIKIDVNEALRDGRVRRPGQFKYSIDRAKTAAVNMNERPANSASSSTMGAESILDTAAAEASKLQQRRGAGVPTVQIHAPSPAAPTSPTPRISSPKQAPK